LAQKKNGKKNKEEETSGRSSAKRTAGRKKKNQAKNAEPAETQEDLDRKEKIREMQEKRRAKKQMKDTIWGIVLVALGVFVFAAVQFHAAGEFGNILGEVLRGVFGFVGLIFPWYLMLIGVLLIFHKTLHVSGRTVFFMFLLLLMICIINSARFIDSNHIFYAFKKFYTDGVTLDSGGVFGMTTGMILTKFFGKSGLYIISIVVILISLLLILDSPISRALVRSRESREEKRLIRTMKQREEIVGVHPAGNENASAAAAELPAASAAPETAPASQKEELQLPKQEEIVIQIPDAPDTEPAPAGNSASGVTGPSSTSERHTGIKKKLADSFGKTMEIPMDQNKEETEKEPKIITPYQDDPLPFDDPAPAPAAGGTRPVRDFRDFAVGFEQPGDSAEGVRPISADNVKTKANGAKNAGSGASKAAAAAAGAGAAAGIAEAFTIPETAQPVKEYHMPPIDLLKKNTSYRSGDVSRELRQKAKHLEKTLKSFNVDARVVQVTQGPAVTRYELEPAPGVKVNAIKTLSNDIALNLKAKSIRMEAPIPGKAAVGIEVENDHRNMVSIREIIDSPEFKNAESKITFAVGKDIAGKSIVADLKGMPHLLIAGSTGSGKSVCINSILTSILYKARPDEVKLLLIDPKVVELGNYNGIPHLLIPVVTDPSKAAAALNWAVAEMNTRYKTFAEKNVRDLEAYNKKMKRSHGPIMPQVVIIIDELADLMMAAPRQVEESIARLAQMARAAGMHLIVATQRPSVDIITGVIKANIPSRIAFTVSSQVDSRTILDMGGAEKLVGKGDMLFRPLDANKPTRIQGTFISDEEVNSVIEYVKGQTEEADYSEEIIDSIENESIQADDPEDTDELLPDAIECVVDTGQASTSMLQRRFRIGYNRAARMMDMLEDRGIVGPQDGSRPRQVLLSKEEYEQQKQGGSESA
jgi:S-DNA-T family DNA segregation ATPase FtsK/SpoIIIE